jgi:hypothetical protein
MPAEKLDLYKEFKDEYVKSKKPVIIKIRPAKHLTVHGKGAPGGDVFQEAAEALYTAAFTIKMKKKFAGEDYRVCGLEGFWWLDDPSQDFMTAKPETWNWKLTIRVPDFITKKDLGDAVKEAIAKGKTPKVNTVSLETIREGLCVQVLHIGPYVAEAATIAAMHDVADASGFEFHGLHHELYFSDPHRVAPEKLKTLLRIPVKKNTSTRPDSVGIRSVTATKHT